jgi:polyisoprenoid-binding protein YceI
MKFNAVLFALALFAAVPVRAQDTWQVDRTHSSIEFAVTHMMVSEVTGHFKDFDVTMTTTGDDFTTAKLEATIKVGSVSTDNDNRDNHLRSADFFDAEKYPDATFKSTKWEKVGEGKYKVTGDLTIRGNTKPVVLDVTQLGMITDPRGGTKTGWRAETTIDRFEFGTVWDKAIESGGLVVSKDVRLTLRVAMKKAGAEPKGPPPDKK